MWGALCAFLVASPLVDSIATPCSPEWLHRCTDTFSPKTHYFHLDVKLTKVSNIHWYNFMYVDIKFILPSACSQLLQTLRWKYIVYGCYGFEKIGLNWEQSVFSKIFWKPYFLVITKKITVLFNTIFTSTLTNESLSTSDYCVDVVIYII